MARNVFLSLVLAVSVACCLARSTYRQYAIQAAIPYYPDATNAAVPFTYAPRLRVKLQNGNVFHERHPIIDTGTCGAVVSINAFPSWSQSLADANEVGWEFLSSSKLLYSGHWIPVDMSFPDAPMENKARVPVLVVEDITTCPHYDSATDKNICPPVDGVAPNVTHHPTGIALFGVGFGRRTDGQPQGTPDKNPFLNFVSINDIPTTSNELFRNGYIIDKTGITIGLTGSNTRGIIRWHQLQRGTLWDVDHRDWAAIQACLSVDANPCAQGTLLVDTGISHSYLTLPKSTVVRYHQGINPSTNSTVSILDDGTVVHLKVDAEFGSSVNQRFVVGDPRGIERGVVPGEVLITLRDESVKPPFMNTGRHFLRKWRVMFDADGGKYGFQKMTSLN